jgi:hypothetical protein
MTMWISRGLARARQDQGGWALITAIILMAIMMTTGVALAAVVDNETKQSGLQRNRETAFNLAEAALNAQVFALAADWPGPGYSGAASTSRTGQFVGGVWIGAQYGPCSELNTGATELRCPIPSQLRGLFPTQDADPDAKWTSQVIDNAPPYDTYYSDAALTGAKGYDSNNDGKVWVRVSATIKKRTRTLVSLVRAERQAEDIIHAAVVAGSVSFGNNGTNGNKQFVDTGTTGYVEVRCVPDQMLGPCVGYPYPPLGTDTTKWENQVTTGISPYRVHPGSTVPTITEETLTRLKQDAASAGTYYNDCPPTADKLAGTPTTAGAAATSFPVVVIDAHRDCLYNGSDTINAGMVILLNNDSSLSLSGSITFNGLIYHANKQVSILQRNPLVSLTGNAIVRGGVIIDGNGAMFMDGSALLKFDEAEFGQVQTTATAGIIQNTWRELKAGS